ncbi:hypothetical protein MKQ70_19940 [Chitinophaga sedimenti]|uniref:hypothetical protein n=1 Tax=Chitinophaga sedimenti TaxID=2033606 RepID=UPI0020044220|nr:hypothetical protein [Chitinophaga sedimenti]MCK7557153.1 hypothetical protein [Chitinophaga sedimenti]
MTARLLQPLWPAFRPEELSVITITNGIHFPTWLSAAWPEALLAHAEAVNDMEPATIWEIRLQLKKQLAAALRRRLAKMNYYDNADTVQRRAVDTLDENTLYIGFARRFAPYKRADLLFTDTDRLRNLLADSRRPVYLLIAGKAHPNDAQGINLLKKSRHYPSRKDFPDAFSSWKIMIWKQRNCSYRVWTCG